jgi:ABC-type antimicrobial peptide transport system permease subunit
MEGLIEQQEIQRRFQTWLLSVFSGLALALAVLGVFGVMHYSVAARTNEIGIRMAVGARSSDIVTLVLGNGAALATAGIAVGALTALWSTTVISGMLYGVKPTDPLSFAVAAFLLLAFALLATYLPAHRASRIDPLSALRQE